MPVCHLGHEVNPSRRVTIQVRYMYPHLTVADTGVAGVRTHVSPEWATYGDGYLTPAAGGSLDYLLITTHAVCVLLLVHAADSLLRHPAALPPADGVLRSLHHLRHLCQQSTFLLDLHDNLSLLKVLWITMFLPWLWLPAVFTHVFLQCALLFFYTLQ